MSWSRRLFVFFYLVAIGVVSAISVDVEGASYPPPPSPQWNQRPSPSSHSNAQFQEIYAAINKLRTEVNNHEVETRTFDERINNLDVTLDGIRDEIGALSKSSKEQIKNSATGLEEKLLSLDTTVKGVVEDMRQFKAHTNEVTAALVGYHQRLGELEKVIDQQNQNIDHLQAAIKALMEVLQPKASNIKNVAVDGKMETYQVQPGDSLEKIARKYNTTVQVLKELNGLTNDKIVVGKKLKVPEK